ncbi:hypothetical protein AB6N24_17750 [Cellulomonas sp. 179-A 4D5 NHS]|uniref:hypothetical protein n=1 Tax=Cellulomonas sp. 179-A 4D5 NHS TaxID=3142378 RepID=UPI00399FB802
MVVGATARNILAGNLGLRGVRATADIDIALVVDGWDAFDSFTSRLQPIGDAGHKFEVLGVEVDVVPCGGVEAADRTLLWRNEHKMNLLGMHEAYHFRTEALLPGRVVVNVPTVAGLALLKIIAWTDRKHTTHRDASDLAEILDWQSQGVLLEALYLSAPQRLERYDFDVNLAGANRLGAEMAVVMGVGVAQLTEAFPEAAIDLLASHMPRTVVDRVSMLRALFDGLSAVV